MTRLRRPDLPPHLEERMGKQHPVNRNLQVNNMPWEESECECPCHREPDYAEMLRYWNEVPE